MSRPNNTTSIDQLFDLEQEEKSSKNYSHYMKGNTPTSMLLDPVRYHRGEEMNVIHGMEYQAELEERNYRDRLHYPPPIHNIPSQNVHQECVIHCKDILKHIKECEICMKFYNNDKSVYIVLLMLFGLVIIILLKKVMEK